MNPSHWGDGWDARFRWLGRWRPLCRHCFFVVAATDARGRRGLHWLARVRVSSRCVFRRVGLAPPLSTLRGRWPNESQWPC